MQKSESTPLPHRARGRPRNFDRDAALGRAMELFWANGYEGTSISDLTERMGIGTKSLYAAFGSKEQLFSEALQLYLATFEKVIWDGFDGAKTAREAVKAFLHASAMGMTRPLAERPRGCMVTLTFFGNHGPEALDRLIRSTRSGLFDVLVTRLKRALDEGELSQSTDIVQLARFVQVIHSGMTVRSRDGASQEELEAVVAIAMAGWDSTVSRPGIQSGRNFPQKHDGDCTSGMADMNSAADPVPVTSEARRQMW
jgi:AcrR family transcriptional regulator